jgi:hypothetical protein
MAHSIVVADTSLLINLLKIDRMDLIGACPRRFLATDHVASEIEDHYPEQQARYAAAIAAGQLDTSAVTDEAEIDLFRRLRPGQRLGAGECSGHGGYPSLPQRNRDRGPACRSARRNPRMRVVTIVCDKGYYHI